MLYECSGKVRSDLTFPLPSNNVAITLCVSWDEYQLNFVEYCECQLNFLNTLNANVALGVVGATNANLTLML